MATISIYAGKTNQMPQMIKNAKTAVNSLKTELASLKKKSIAVDSSICNLDDVVSSISATVKTQEDKAATLDTVAKKSEEFIEKAVKVDNDAADKVNQNKEDFYDKYSYLKPDCEKSKWEKFCDGCKKVVEWCKDNWKSIVKIVAAVVIIVALGIASVLTGGTLAIILAGAFWGALAGGLIGGLMGGILSAITGGSFLEGFADGLLSGTITGAITGAIAAGGSIFGAGVKCGTTLAKALSVTSKVTGILSLGMDGFDIMAMGIGMFDPNNPLVQLNQKLHSSKVYTFLQLAVNAAAIFTAGASSTMKCFVAGTLILTAAGYAAIEKIRAGDKVISTDPDTMEVAEKTVLETYVREANEVVHLTVNGEVITSTLDHPFYVQNAGFVGAGDLYIGDKLLDAEGNTLLVEDMKFETLVEPVKVYNFKVDEFHTYHVGNYSVLVHNADYSENMIPNKREGLRREEEVEIDLQKAYPESEGYSIERERLLRDANGKKAIDPETGTGRRIDYVVDKDGKVVDSIEVTSKTAPKDDQIAKEARIRQNGGNYVRTKDGDLIEIPSDIITRLDRRD